MITLTLDPTTAEGLRLILKARIEQGPSWAQQVREARRVLAQLDCGC